MAVVDIYNTKKKYKVIYADPAWQFNSKKTGGSMSSGAGQHYTVTSIEDIKAMPVKDLCEDDCLLVMWWVGAMPQEAIDLCHAWGFKLCNMNGFVWRKLTVTGKPFFGMGHTTRAGSESAIIGYRGKLSNLIRSKSVRAVVETDGFFIPEEVGKHSEKPQVFRDQIIELVGKASKIELFSRKKVRGWDCYGNEV